MANDRGAFWEDQVRRWRVGDYPEKADWMRYVRMWFEEPDIGLADIAWDLVSMELGLDEL